MTDTATTASAPVDDPSERVPTPSNGRTSSLSDPVWRVVAGREMAVKIRDRGFLISTFVTLALILGVLGAQLYFGSSAEQITIGEVGSESAAVIKQAAALANQADDSTEITGKRFASDAALQAAVLSGQVDAGLVTSADGWTLIGKTDPNSTVQTWIGAAAQQTALERNTAAAGTTVTDLMRGSSVKYSLLSPNETPDAVVRGSTSVFGFLFYVIAALLGVSLATSVVEEKQSRIVEIIASSIRLRDLLIGKIVGNTIMALVQVVVFAVAAVIALRAMDQSEVLEQITPGLGWFLLFYTVGIALLACIYAAAGAIATRIQDIQSTTTPITLLVAVVFIAGISASGTFQTVISFVPLTSTIVMPGRIVAGDTSWWEPVASLLISLITAAVVVLVSERIYRRALMQTGGKLSFRQAYKLTD